MTRQEKLDNLIIDLQENYILSQDEANAVVMFKSSDCRGLSSKIRTNSLTSEERAFSENLTSGLSKIPPTTEETIYRHLNFLDFQIEKVEKYFQSNIGKKIRFTEFQSCSRRQCFTGDSNHHNWTMKILTNSPTNAKDLFSVWNKHKLNDAEEEVLLLNNSCFEVISVDPRSDIKVHLKEIQTDLLIEAVPEF